MTFELLLAIIAIIISISSVIIQKKELSAQREELSKTAKANEKSQQSLNLQAKIQALSSQLNAEIHLHNFNNKKEINPEKQKKWATENFNKIQEIKQDIANLL
ncbi:MAG: hypothetical protein DSZ09_01945 [Sulfurovum sp.]|nr:MAG: hypothetical protein DSZ09_01945 [Sulfurovum sp.]